MSIGKERLTFFSLILLTIIVYYFSSPGETAYNYFTRLSESFLSGKLYLNEHPSWLNELVPVDNKYYVVYPPMPAILMAPFLVIFKNLLSQTLFSIILGGINSGLTYLLLRKINISFKTSLLVSVFFTYGTNHWYLSSIGSSWFLAHIVAIFFLLLSLIEVFGRRRLLLIGLLLGAAFWSRTTVILTLPFFYIFLYKEFWPINRKNIKNFFFFNFGVGVFVLFDLFYNFLRFGQFSPLSPYNLIPDLDKDNMFKDGFMSIEFIPRHIEASFLKLPKFQNTYPYMIPSIYSLAVWFTSPALFLIFKVRRNLLVLACWLGLILPLAIIFTWAGVGYAQFGYRFLQDVMPFLLILLSFGIGPNPKRIAVILVLVSILVNLWGTVYINKLNIFYM